MEASTSSSRKEGKISEIVFFNLETTVPRKIRKLFYVLEFGTIVVCAKKLIELESYTTLIRPADLSAVGSRSSRMDGITRDKVANAPLFEEVADEIFGVLNGRIWAGHNIQRFDVVRIKEAFADIGRPSPEPVGLIDSLGVLGHKFGRRAGNMKMATLAWAAGAQSSLPSLLKGNLPIASPTIMTRSRSNYFGKLASSTSLCREEIITSRKSPPKTTLNIGYQRSVPYTTRSSSLAKMTESVKNLLCKANGNQPLNHIIKHSHSLLR